MEGSGSGAGGTQPHGYWGAAGNARRPVPWGQARVAFGRLRGVPSTQTCRGSLGSGRVAEGGQLPEEPGRHLRSHRRKQQEHSMGGRRRRRKRMVPLPPRGTSGLAGSQASGTVAAGGAGQG